MLQKILFEFFSYLFIFSSKDPDPVKIEYFLKELKDFKSKLYQRNKQIDAYSHKFPSYSIPNFDSSILGTISFETSMEHIKLLINDDNSHESNISKEDEINDNESTISEESQQNYQEEIKKYDNISPPPPPPLPLTTLENLPNKKLLWSLNFKFVPQYISLYRQSILFASDRWGFVR